MVFYGFDCAVNVVAPSAVLAGRCGLHKCFEFSVLPISPSAGRPSLNYHPSCSEPY